MTHDAPISIIMLPVFISDDGKRSVIIGLARTASPIADGNAIIILNFIAISVFFLASAISPSATDDTRFGIIEDAIAVETAIGTLTSSLYFVLYIPCNVLTTLSEYPSVPITLLKMVTSIIPLN